MKDLISIIVPLYNVEDYLEECLDSLLKQTYKNLEIILIDDGSKDRTGEICDEYAKKDFRIQVVHKENGGVSKARNVGLERAKGEYITFVDSDDYLFENGIEILHQLCIENQAELSIAGVQDIENGQKARKSREVCAVYDTEETIRNFLDEKYFQCVIWGKMYKKDLIGTERFREDIRIAEDFEFLYRVLNKVKKVSIDTTKMVYYYRIRGGSLMREKYNKNFENEIVLSEDVMEDVRAHFPNLISYAQKRYQRICLSCIDKYFRENNEINGVSYLLKKLEVYKISLEPKDKLKLFLLKHQRWLLRKIYKKTGKIN